MYAQSHVARVTIKDVARRSGLSPSTVSRALNKSGYVSGEDQRCIDAAISELGYQPNWIARSLKGKPSRTIGLIIPDIFNLYYTALAYSVSDTLRAHEYALILCVSNEDPEIDLSYLKTLREKRVDGIIYAHPACGHNSPFVRELANSGMPIVELNRQREKDILDAVLADNFQGAYQMTEYCLNLGHRRDHALEEHAVVDRDRDLLLASISSDTRIVTRFTPRVRTATWFPSRVVDLFGPHV